MRITWTVCGNASAQLATVKLLNGVPSSAPEGQGALAVLARPAGQRHRQDQVVVLAVARDEPWSSQPSAPPGELKTALGTTRLAPRFRGMEPAGTAPNRHQNAPNGGCLLRFQGAIGRFLALACRNWPSPLTRKAIAESHL
jgi:hypothetical protein